MASLPHTIKEALQLVAKGDKNQLVAASLHKLNEIRHLNAFTYIAPKNRLNFKKPSSKPRPLEGIPIAIKDNFCVDGMPATCGSKMLTSFIAPYNATAVQKLIDAGAIIMGKTNMDEFGMGNGTVDSVFGPTKNPWGFDQFGDGTNWYVPGGSSGGSAVSVASGAVLGALGSDTGGSVRNPASYCGVVGLKPTYGTISRHGLIPLVNSMDVPGVLSKTVDDCALIYDAIKGWDALDSTTSSKVPSTEATTPSVEGNIANINIGLPTEYHSSGLSPEVSKTWKELAEKLEKEGASISQVSLPHTKYSIVTYSVLNPCEVASNMARYDGLRFGHRSNKKGLNSTESLYAQTRHEGFNAVVRGRILAGNYFLLKANYDKYFQQALKVRRLIAKDFDAVWSSGVQLLLTPVTLSTAPSYKEFSQWDNRTQSSVQDFCTQSANLAGIPALSLPIKLSSTTGTPISLQLIGPKFSEKLIFEVAKRIENLVNFKHLQ